MADFLDIAPKRKTPAARNVCVDQIGSRPRGNLCVPKIWPGERERRQTYGDIANSARTSTSVLLSSFTRPGGRKPYLAIPSKPVKAATVLFYWLRRAWRLLGREVWTTSVWTARTMSEAPGRVRPIAEPLRRACTHTCPPSHARHTHVRHQLTQIVIFWEKNYRIR